MQYIVLPNSALGPRTRPAPFIVHVNGYVGHALLVGLPIALISRWSAKRQMAKNSGLRTQETESKKELTPES